MLESLIRDLAKAIKMFMIVALAGIGLTIALGITILVLILR